MTARVRHSSNFAHEGALLILESAQEAIASRGIFRLALSGGETPRRIHAELAQISTDLDWSKVLVTFGDERCVPPDHADSNFGMAKSSLLDHVAIPPENVLRIRGEVDAQAAADEYEILLAKHAKAGEPRFVHDLILLGLGADGHTASLFPETTALAVTDRNVAANWIPKLNASRVTFTYPLIEAARHICFLVADGAKRGVVDEVIAGDPRHPASRVAASPQASWFLGF